jgi:hypothetical protein
MLDLPGKDRRTRREAQMNAEHDPRRGQVRLPAFDESGGTRSAGIRRVRRMSNWTAAALIVGTGATTAGLAHHAVSVTAPPAAASSSASGVATASGTQGANGPQVSHSVATTSASGVTTTTTTQVVNGKPVVSQVRNAPAYHDN